MVGNLSRRDCTTVFYNVTSKHSDVYYFRVQMEPDRIRFTVTNNFVNIKVLDVPKPPKLNDLPEVMEGTEVNLICSAEAPCPKQPPTLSWTNIHKSANIITQLQDKPDQTQEVISRMIFNVSYMDHKMNISCNATYPRNISNNTTVHSTVMLQVLFSPKETRFLIEPNASVSVGTNVTLTCQSKANPSSDLNYTWYKRGEQEPLAFGKQMTFNVSKTNGGWYFCRAKNKHGSQTSEEIQLIVKVGSSESFIVPLIVGGVGGVFAFLLLCLLMTIFIRKQRTQASNVPVIREADFSDQDQKNHKETNATYTNSAFVTSEKPETPKDEGDIHYGEINFTPVQTENITEKSSGQETVYAEVCAT
ncbi:myelin-associated glycoprotein isoform X2 [Misgurnus anguillicaudatus]|uniref:myelin-associated glycoprotein isoform X2 n=1 Tax=Misgurnus anguillicaudatus TaxID=75329 RepID=UPI003CCF07EC